MKIKHKPDQVQADFSVRVDVHKIRQDIQVFNFHQEVTCFRFGVVAHEVADNLLGQAQEDCLLARILGLGALIPLLRHLTG